MGMAVTLDNELVKAARSYSEVQSRSVPKQIEHWAKIGRIAEENPDLPYGIIMGILTALQDVKAGKIETYRPGLL